GHDREATGQQSESKANSRRPHDFPLATRHCEGLLFHLSAGRTAQPRPTRRAIKRGLILAFIPSRVNRRSQNKMPSVGHYVFKCSAVLNQIRILTPDPLSSVPFFCSPGWQPKLLRSCHFVDAASAGAIGFRAISNSEEFRVRDK